MRAVLSTFIFVALIVGGKHVSAAPLPESGHASRWPVCKDAGGKPLETSFDIERSVVFRERNGGRSHFETADNILQGGRMAKCTHNQYKSQDQAQTMAAADLLSRAKEISTKAQEDTLKAIREMKACAGPNPPATPACEKFKKTVLPKLQEEFMLMRALRAIALASPSGCGGYLARLGSPAARTQEISGMFASQNDGCLAQSKISHDVPFMSKLFGGAETPKQLAPLSAREQALVREMYAKHSGKFFSGGRRGTVTDDWKKFRDAAQADYESLMLKYPIFNYLEGETLEPNSLVGSLAQTERNAVASLERTKKAPLTEIGTHDGALAMAISELPPEMRGDYCHVANQLGDDLAKRRLGRTMLFVGAGLATMGLGLVPATLVGAAAEGAMAYTSMNEYALHSLRCQSGADTGSGACSPERLKDARDSLYSPTDGALFLAGGAIDAVGAARHLLRAGTTPLTVASGVPSPTAALTDALAPGAKADSPLGMSPTGTGQGIQPLVYNADDASIAKGLRDGTLQMVDGKVYPTSSLPQYVAGQRVTPDPRFMLDEAYRMDAQGNPLRVLGRNPKGELVVESIDSEGKLTLTTIARENERAFASQPFKEAREVFLVREAKNVEIKRVGDHTKIESTPVEPVRAVNAAGMNDLTYDAYRIQFKSKEGTGTVYHSIEVRIPEGWPPHHQDALKQRLEYALSQLPTERVDAIRSIEIAPYTPIEIARGTEGLSVSRGALAHAYGGSQAGHITIYLDSFKHLEKTDMFKTAGTHVGRHFTYNDPIVDLIHHEGGHAIAFTQSGGRTAIPTGWEVAASFDKYSVSGYGSTNAAEDFAETMRVFLATDGGRLQPQIREYYEHRFRYIEENFFARHNFQRRGY